MTADAVSTTQETQAAYCRPVLRHCGLGARVSKVRLSLWVCPWRGELMIPGGSGRGRHGEQPMTADAVSTTQETHRRPTVGQY